MFLVWLLILQSHTTHLAPKFQQADYPLNQLDEQFTYVDFTNINWDPVSETWKQIPYAK